MKRISALIAALAASLTMTAHAGSLTLGGYQHDWAPNGKVTVNDSGLGNTRSTTVAASGLKGTFTDGSVTTDGLTLWCIELFAPTGAFGSAVSNYSQSLGVSFGGTVGSRLEKLFVKQYVANPFGNFAANAIESAAVQLSVWEILYDDTEGFGDLTANTWESLFGADTNGFWTASMSGARSVAETILADLDNFDTTGYNVSFDTYTHVGSKRDKLGKQDFLSVNVDQDFGGCQDFGCEVPEPASLALAGGALLGLGIVTRRRKTEVVTEDDQA